MKILGIETSCDETAVAVIEAKSNTVQVISNTVSSQVKLHAKYGGVVPNLAAREHSKNIGSVFKLALKEAKTKIKDIDLVAVTRGPGLGPSLLVGIAFARTLAWKYDKPLIGVNHLEGHIYSNWLPGLRNPKSETLNSKQYQSSKLQIQNKKIFPILNLIVSGGHTELVLMTDHGKYEIIGETLDDAVGEAFDKVARLLDLGYPGGPAISARAEKFQITNSKLQTNSKSQIPKITLPRPMEHSKDFNFSYSGLKTAVLYLIRDLKADGVKITNDVVNEIAYEFQKAALDVLILKTVKAAQEYKVKLLLLSGGVSANKELRKRLETEAKKLKIKYSQPDIEYTTDNAAMIAAAGYFKVKSKNEKVKTDWESVEMDANLGFEDSI